MEIISEGGQLSYVWPLLDRVACKTKLTLSVEINPLQKNKIGFFEVNPNSVITQLIINIFVLY